MSWTEFGSTTEVEQRVLYETWKKQERRKDVRAGHVTATLINTMISLVVSKQDRENIEPLSADSLFPDPDKPAIPARDGSEDLRAFIQLQYQHANTVHRQAALERIKQYGG